MTGVWVWDVEHDAMIEVTRAEAAAGVQLYARSLGAGTAACGVWEQRAVELAQPEPLADCGICQLPVFEGERVEEYAGLMSHYGCAAARERRAS